MSTIHPIDDIPERARIWLRTLLGDYLVLSAHRAGSARTGVWQLIRDGEGFFFNLAAHPTFAVDHSPRGKHMADQVKVGVVGTSWWSEWLYFPVLTDCKGAELVAVCGRNGTRAHEMAAKYHIPQVFTNYQDMIGQADLDALIVATPDNTHYPITMMALNKGLHVLCEKPLATDAKQAMEMLDTAHSRGVKHMVMFTWRWMPHYLYLKHLIDEGYIGHTYHFHLRFLGNRGRTKEYTWRFDSQYSIGVLGDLGSHMIDLAQWLLGDITRVCAHLASYVERQGIDGRPFVGANESALLVVENAQGAQGMIHVSTVAHTADRLREQYVSLHGEEGTLQVDWIIAGVETGATIRGAQQQDTSFSRLPIPQSYLENIEPAQFRQVFERHLAGPRVFIDAIQNDYMPSPNFSDGYKAQQVMDAAIASHATGCWVDVQ
jgi:predicted dehydrogenase